VTARLADVIFRRRTVALALVRNAVMLIGLVFGFGMKASYSQQARAYSSYPERPIRFIVPFPPAGANDVLARAVGQRLTSAWGQPVIIDNRPGEDTS
jgi:tripartite-type tricarboxylate transporter receptor subunit TctC